jgi:TfdA family taurine catabolism dioxygenase TauD
MNPFPKSACISIGTELASEFLASTPSVNGYNDTELLDVSVQQQLLNQVRSRSKHFDDLIDEISAALNRSPYCACVKGLSFDDANLLFATICIALGDLVEPYRGLSARVMRTIKPLTDRDEGGYGSLNTHLHTDGTDWLEPNDVTCLLGVHPDQFGGGETRLLDVDALKCEIETHFDARIIHILSEAPVPWRIIEELGGGIIWKPIFSKEGVRYMKYTIEASLAACSASLSRELKEGLTIVNEVVATAPRTIGLMLNRNDLLLVNNKRCLHARTIVANPELSKREMLRLKVRKRPNAKG